VADVAAWPFTEVIATVVCSSAADAAALVLVQAQVPVEARTVFVIEVTPLGSGSTAATVKVVVPLLFAANVAVCVQVVPAFDPFAQPVHTVWVAAYVVFAGTVSVSVMAPGASPVLVTVSW
jgi:hypothetical protein